jgi:predicted DNA-binding WGR domain protein
VRRFYSLMIERDLFGTIQLVRNWGRIGTNGQELVEVFAGGVEAEARQMIEMERARSLGNGPVVTRRSHVTDGVPE